ncbi:hypothetical protein [Pedobacter nutrimenti]|uniref:hypothetical protein n=1 Tax=Pedobacter nutrimenti TaxID=1241337 RepID=UPI002930FAE8|nr:hypothetical protein [Pedobacter nutrimenti]
MNKLYSLYISLLLACVLLFPGIPLSAQTSLHDGQPDKTYESIISVNQSGYNIGWTKRFTAPLIADGTLFRITESGKTKVLFTGKISGHIGDFSDFNPSVTGVEYVISVTRNIQFIQSFPFSIGKFWMERSLTQPAVDFMIDDRSVIGTHPSAWGGAPWRDGTAYSYEVPSMVLQYLANPEFYEQAPRQIDYNSDKNRILASDFKYIMAPEGSHALQTARDYYTKIDAPIGSKVPDIINNIHWGIGFYLLNPVTQDPSGGDEGRRLHPQTLEQFAYFLYGYPYYKQYFTESYYKQVKKFVLDQWAYTGLLGVFSSIGSAKGREAPGHSIMPNLFMYEVAQRDGDANAQKYFDAAFRQTKWVIDSLDFNRPENTKGQRMSEHVLIPALVYFLKQYPDKSPKGLKQKIEKWVDIAISRSENLWDFRRYNMQDLWTVPGFSETGNIAGFPSVALSASIAIDDETKKARLLQLSAAAVDDLFGRNPQNSCAAFHQKKGFSGLEKGWPKSYMDDVCARLELVRGTFSSISTTEMYPYNPNGKFGWLEGWTAFNSAWNKSLAYIHFYDTQFQVKNRPSGKSYLQLQVPGYPGREPKTIEVLTNEGKRITLTQTAQGSQVYIGTLEQENLAKGTTTISYGYALFKKTISLKSDDKGNIIIL